MSAVRIAVVPAAIDAVVDAVKQAGGIVTSPEEADGLIWTDPGGAEDLKALLPRTPARWIQLPFAGIERFFDAGAIDPARTWTCAKRTYGAATAEMALALMLAAARRLHVHIRSREWTGDTDPPMRTLRDTTALIVGTGGIGQALAGFLAPLGVRILASSRSGTPVAWAHETHAGAGPVADADWIVIAAALTPESRGLFGAQQFAAMRPGAWLINVARGGLVDTGAMVDALRANAIGGAALDVTDPEPLPPDHPLWTFDNVIVTSHTANTHRMAVPELATLTRRNVRAFAAGEPLEGLVDPSLGY